MELALRRNHPATLTLLALAYIRRAAVAAGAAAEL